LGTFGVDIPHTLELGDFVQGFSQVQQSLSNLGILTTNLSKHCSADEKTQIQRFDKIWKVVEDLVHNSQQNFVELDKSYVSLKGHFEDFTKVWCPSQISQVVESLNILRDNCVKESAFVKQNLSQIHQVLSRLQVDR
jgi:hypothetical protein